MLPLQRPGFTYLEIEERSSRALVMDDLRLACGPRKFFFELSFISAELALR